MAFHPEHMHTWLTINNANALSKLNKPEITDAMAMLYAPETSIAAPSMAAITGSNAESATSNTDWETNPALGAVNCANMARNAAGYVPKLLGPNSDKSKFEDFKRRIMTCPLYTIKLADTLDITRKDENWNTLINAIADTFTGIADKDKGSIVKGLKSLAQAASSKMEQNEQQNVFVQNVVNVDDVISYYLYDSQTTFYEKKGKGYDTKQATFKVLRLRLEFQSALWPDWWHKVKEAYDGTMDDWLNDNKTSTEGTKPIPALN